MGEEMEKIKKIIKSVIKHISRITIIVLLPIILIVILLGAAFWFIVSEDASYNENDWGSTDYAASQYTGNVKTSADGKLESSTTAQELWDKMIKNGSSVDKYLDKPEELLKLMNAEIVTQFPDTRDKDSIENKEIDWDSINNANSKNVQGIIKMKRADNTNSEKYTMTYVDPSTFQSYIEEYNKSGSEEAKNKALSHFTLGSYETGSSSNIAPNVSGDGWCWPTDGTTITSTFGLRSAPVPGASSNHKAIDIGVKEGTNVYACEAGKVIISQYSNSAGNYISIDHGNGYVTTYMHNSQLKVSVGDTVQKGQVIALSGSTGHSSGPHVHFQVEYNSTRIDPLIFKYTNGMGDGTISTSSNSSSESSDNSKNDENKEDNKDNNNNNSIQSLNNFLVIGDSIAGSLESPLKNEGATVVYKVGENASFFLSDKFDWNNKIANLNTPSGICLFLGQNLCGGGDSWINKGIEDIKKLVSKLQQQFPNVPIYINEVVPTIKNCSTYPKYMNDYSKVVEALKNYCSSTNGVNFIESLSGYKTDDGYAKDGMTGDGLHPNSTGANILVQNIKSKITSSDSTEKKADGNSRSSTSKYYAVVATWSEVTDKIESNDPDQEESTSVQYNMTTTNINYQDLVSGYTMPFHYLWTMLVITDDKDFVMQLADLVYNSNIEITVHDNLMTNTNVDVYTYTKKKKTETEATVKVTGTKSNGKSSKSKSGKWTDEEKPNYKTTYTTITKTNTLNADVTLADVWMARYEKEYTYEVPDDSVVPSSGTIDDIDYPSEPSTTGSNDTYGHAQSLISHLKEEMQSDGYTDVDGKVDKIKEKIYIGYVNRKESITDTVHTTRYVASPLIVEEKTDKQSEKPNFVTIFCDQGNSKARNNILNVKLWLFDLLENDDTTKNGFVDLTKYLLYKATGDNFDITEFDFSIFRTKRFKSLGSYGGYVNIDGVPGEVYNFLLDKGVSPIGAASILGNIEGESGFRPAVVNEIGASGLCQWLGGRLTNLKALANSKGVDWTDVNVQLEHMWNELESSYPNVKNVILNSTEESELEYAVWYWGRYFEVYFLGSSFEGTKYMSAKRYQYAQKWYKSWQENHTDDSKKENTNTENSNESNKTQ